MPKMAELKSLYQKGVREGRNIDPVFKATGWWWIWADVADSNWRGNPQALTIYSGEESPNTNDCQVFAVRRSRGLLEEANTGNDALDKSLLEAVQAGNTLLVKEMLEKGADVNAHVNTTEAKFGYTALHQAVLSESTDMEIITLLLENGAHPDPKSRYSETPLAHAVFANKSDVVAILLKYGADVNAERFVPETMKYYTALSLAKEKGHEDLVQLLKAAGAKD